MWYGFAIAYIIGFGIVSKVQASHGDGGANVTTEYVDEELNFGAFGSTKASQSLQTRQIVQVPKDYGQLVTILSSENGPILWYQAADGTIRNVLVRTWNEPILIRREGLLKSPKTE